MQDLPLEIQAKILNWLDLPDVCFLSLVNKSYLDLLGQYQGLMEALYYYKLLPQSNHERWTEILKKLETRKKGRGIYVMNLLKIDGYKFSFCHKYLPYIKELVINDQTNYVPWNDLGESVFQRITEIQYSGIANTNSQALVPLVTKLVNLRNVSLIFMIPANVLCEFIQLLPTTRIQNLSFFTIPAITSMGDTLASILPSTQIESLSISNCGIDDNFGIAIANVLCNTKVTFLKFHNNRITSSLLAHLGRQKTKLKEAVFWEDCMQDPSSVVWYDNLPNMKIEKLSFCHNAYKDNLISVIKTSNLLELELLTHIPGVGDLLNAVQGSKLKLLFFDIFDDEDNDIVELSNYLPNTTLEEIIIDTSISSSNAWILVNSLTPTSNLQSLTISTGKKHLKKIFNHLQHTNLTRFSVFTDALSKSSLQNISESLILSKLKYLALCASHSPGKSWIRFIQTIKDSSVAILEIQRINNKQVLREIRQVLGDHSKLRVEYCGEFRKRKFS
ncbi:hypothetical protein HDV06_001063 [Boothiomyces sp. JEL0866]|nr:hypothetical protein HDV06_001063 [Boothiomyces sp. JEL0866]